MDTGTIISIISAAIALASCITTIVIHVILRNIAKVQATIEEIHLLQREVLDNLIYDDNANVKLIIENLDQPECKKAYKDYKTLIARLEHFAVGINQKIYDFNVAYTLVGAHFVYLYDKIEHIIAKANEHVAKQKYYVEFTNLVYKFKAVGAKKG